VRSRNGSKTQAKSPDSHVQHARRQPRNGLFPTRPAWQGTPNVGGNPESKWRFCGTSLGGGAFDTDDVYKTYEQPKVRREEFQSTPTMQDRATPRSGDTILATHSPAKAGE